MRTRPTLNVNNKQIRNFSMEHYMHRYFNETPAINRHIAEINRKNNVVARLLENKEAFVNEPRRDDPRDLLLKRGPDNKPPDRYVNEELANKEPFTVKKKVTFGDIIDSVLTFILVVVFIIFMGNLAYICFFQDNDDDGLFI